MIFCFRGESFNGFKSRRAAPHEEQSEEYLLEFSEDREQLLKEMLEYQRFKQVAKGLQDFEEKHFGSFYGVTIRKALNKEEELADANIWQLFRALSKKIKSP